MATAMTIFVVQLSPAGTGRELGEVEVCELLEEEEERVEEVGVRLGGGEPPGVLVGRGGPPGLAVGGEERLGVGGGEPPGVLVGRGRPPGLVVGGGERSGLCAVELVTGELCVV